MSLPVCFVHALFIGKPKTLADARGFWQSSIDRDPIMGQAQLETRGFVGDQATQPYHGSPELAVCLHARTHYQYWHETLQMNLQPGAVGENMTLDTWDDSLLCVDDVLRVGSAGIQISAPRTPCENQARFVGRADWVKLTIQALRTGIYARVLEPGSLQAGDQLHLEARPNPELTIQVLNNCFYHSFDPFIARRFIEADGLMDWWKQRLQVKVLEQS